MSERNRRRTAADDKQAGTAAQNQRRQTRLRKQKPLRRQRSLLEAVAAWQPRLQRNPARPKLPTATPAPPALPASAQRRRVRNNLRPLRSFTFNARAVLMSPRWYSAVLLGLCVYALVMIGTNRRFYLDSIDVQGVNVMPAADIISASGIFGAHVFDIDPNAVAQRIGALPGIRSVQVELRWPDALTIAIEEDMPLLKWQENGETFWVNEDGAIIPAVGRDLDLLLIQAELPPVSEDHCAAETESEEAGAATAEATTVDAALAAAPADSTATADAPAAVQPNTYLCFVPQELIAGALGLQALRPELTTLSYAPIGGLRFQDAGGWSVYMGTGDDMRVKLAVYDALVASLQARGITPEYVNISHLSKPVYKPLNAPPPAGAEG